MNIQHGLKENWQQFVLLVIINAFVGGMLGLERSILPELATTAFKLSSSTVVFSFIIAFGITKALFNLITGSLSKKLGGKKLMVIGWLFAIPIPFIFIFAQHWNWIIFANILLGIQQGLTWTTAVNMKIDLVGKKNRGLAVGINEFAGYLSIGIVAFITGYLASEYGVRPIPFYLGIGFSVAGLLLSIFFLKDTQQLVNAENMESNLPVLHHTFIDTSFRHRSLSTITQAGLVNNLNDGMIWGLLPMLLLSKAFSTAAIGLIVAIYPTVWGLSHLYTGKLSDTISKKKLMFWGMLLQAFAIAAFLFANNSSHFIFTSMLLGFGTALVYPTFINALTDFTRPVQRAAVMGAFRFWRDLGYAIGAIITAVLVDTFGIDAALIFVAGLTMLSAYIVRWRLEDNKQ